MNILRIKTCLTITNKNSSDAKKYPSFDELKNPI